MSDRRPLKLTGTPWNDDALTLRSPPHNFEAEVQLLGAILANNTAWEKVSDFLTPEMFMDARHARIYEACAKLIARGQVASAVTLKNFFEQDATLTEIGGPAYLGKLAAAAVTIINAPEHGRFIHDLYLRRQLIGYGEDVVNRAYAHDLETSAEAQLARAGAELDAIASTGDAEGGLVPVRVGLHKAVVAADAAQKLGKDGVTGLPTHLIDLDRRLRGLHPSDLIIIGGRPGMGKSALATIMAVNAAVHDGAPCAIFSLEMGDEQLGARLLAYRSLISSDKQRGGEIEGDDMMRLVEAEAAMADLPILIDETPGLTLSRIVQRARRAHRKNPLRLIVIDYLQLIESDASARHDNDRVRELGRITRGLKKLAKELHVPVILLSQLSRDVEKRDNKRPIQADLRDSGTIEQDADIILLLYRHEYYLAKERPQKGPKPPKMSDEEHDRLYECVLAKWLTDLERCKGVCEVIIDKNRHGPTGIARLHFNAELTSFGNLARGGSQTVEGAT